MCLSADSKGFSSQPNRQGILLPKKFLAVAACILFVASLSTFYYVRESGFNPNPQQATLPSQGICSPSKQQCPGFGVSNASLRVLARTDINSQQVSFTVTTVEEVPMARVEVYLAGVSLGTVEGPFAPGVPRLVSLGVPTTITVTAGQNYHLVIHGIYAQTQTLDGYWQGIDVVAVGG